MGALLHTASREEQHEGDRESCLLIPSASISSARQGKAREDLVVDALCLAPGAHAEAICR